MFGRSVGFLSTLMVVTALWGCGGSTSSTTAGTGGGSTSGGSSGALGTPATLHTSLATKYALAFYKGSGEGCGALCSYTEGQSLDVTVGSDGKLTIGTLVLSDPFLRSYGGVDNKAEVIWRDPTTKIEYALTNNETGVFSEINVGDGNRMSAGNTPAFLGQIRKSKAGGGTADAGSVPLASAFVFTLAVDDDQRAKAMVGDFPVGIINAPTPSGVGKGTLSITYAGGNGTIEMRLKDAGGNTLASADAPLSVRTFSSTKLVHIFDTLVGSGLQPTINSTGRRLGIFNNLTPTVTGIIDFYESGHLTGTLAGYTFRNGLSAFGTTVPTQFATLAGTHSGPARALTCAPNPVAVDISGAGTVRFTGKAMLSCAAQDVTVTWDGVDDFITTDARGTIWLMLDASKSGGSAPGGGIRLQLNKLAGADALLSAQLNVAGLDGEVESLSLKR